MLAKHNLFIAGKSYTCDDSSPLRGIPHSLEKVCKGLADLKARHSMSDLAYLAILNETEDLDQAKEICTQIQSQFTDVVVLGTGGSTLGAQALVSLTGNGSKLNDKCPTLHFPDNLSPHTMDRLLKEIELERTHFLVISKSGSTAETLAQFFVCLVAVKKVVSASQLKKYFTIIVQAGNNPLHNLATKLKFPILNHPANIGGRYSVFSIVGLLPAMLVGMNVSEIRHAAAEYVQELFNSEDISNNPVVVGACFSYVLKQTKNVGISFMMPYHSQLIEFSRWYQQLWAESIGKDGKGLSPVRAVGPLDQHSQLQLLLDGPEDKFVTVITENVKGAGLSIKVPVEADADLDYLNNKTIGDLVHAEASSTLDILIQSCRPVRHIAFDNINAYSMGELMAHFMLETVLTAYLFDVNPYDQPAVEKGKMLTKKYMASIE